MQVVKNSFIYLGSSILNKMIPFLLLPILTKYLSPKEYGILSIYFIAITLYSAFIGMAMHTNISKNFFNTSRDELSLYMGNIVIILSINTLLYFIVTLVISSFKDSLFSIPLNWIYLIPIISFFLMLNELNTTILRNEGKSYLFGIIEVGNSAIKMVLTIIFLVIFSFGWKSQVLGTFIGAMLFAVVAVIYMNIRGFIKLNFCKDKIKSILHLSMPLIPHVLGSMVIAMSDRLFIERMVSIEMVGIYSVGYMFGMVVMIFTDAFIKAWSPWFYKSLASITKTRKKKIVKYTYIYIVGVFILAFIISLISQLILPYFVDKKFYGASEFILWIAIGYAIQGVYKIFFPYLVHLNKTSFLAVSTTVAALLNLLFNYIFIKEFGAIGAAYATILSFGISALLVFWYQNKNCDMSWNFRW